MTQVKRARKMSDIWKEKPWIITEGYYYNASEMDAWMEKLNVEYDAMDELNIFLWNKTDELEDKLEAVKTWMEDEWEDMNVAYEQDNKHHHHPRWRLKKILEDEQTSEVKTQ